MKRASVSDVSKRAGVSTATVSRVLNSPERVATPTRDRVLEAIQELNFVKSATAFSFKSQTTKNILVAVNNVGNIFYSEIFEGLQRRANAHGYNIIIKSPSLEEGSDPINEALRTGSVDGVITLDDYFPLEDDFALLRKIYQGTPPIVGFAERPDYLPYPHVYVDNRTAAKTLTQHMIDRGHTHIGHLPGPVGKSASSERKAGFLLAMSGAGLTVNPEDIYESGFHRDVGRRVARRLARRQAMPTAVFCANDETAMGFISEMSTLGISVPDDISVVGFDNNSFADVYVPALTTIAQPRGEIGVSAMDLLYDVMTNPRANKNKVVELKFRLASRLSVARLRPTPSIPSR